MEWNGWNGWKTKWNEWNGMEWNNGMEMEWNGMDHGNGMEWNHHDIQVNAFDSQRLEGDTMRKSKLNTSIQSLKRQIFKLFNLSICTILCYNDSGAKVENKAEILKKRFNQNLKLSTTVIFNRTVIKLMKRTNIQII